MWSLSSEELRWYAHQLSPYFRQHVIALGVATSGNCLLLLDALILKWLIDHALAARQLHGSLLAVGMIFLSYETRLVLSSVSMYYTASAYQRFVIDLRMRLLAHLHLLSADYHEPTPVGTVYYVFQSAVHEASVIGGETIPSMLRSLFMVFCVVALMMSISPLLTLLLVPLVPFYLMIVSACKQRLARVYERLDQEQSNMSSRVMEQLTAILQIQLLRRERWQTRNVFHAMARVNREQTNRIRSEIRLIVLNGTVSVLGIVIVLAVGSWQVVNGALTVGGLIACYTYLTRLLDPLNSLADVQAKIRRTAPSIRRIHTMLLIRPSVVEKPAAVALPLSTPGNLEFVGVSFAYSQGRRVLDNVSFSIRSGERIGIVGASGVGKSTMAKLLARLYDPQYGAVRIDGHELRDVSISSLRSIVHYVPQRPALFCGTVEENLRLGDRRISQAELENAADLVGLTEIIQRLPKGWRQELEPDGRGFSGGERQRIEIARAIVCRPRILILDESTSNLDASAERCLFERLHPALQHITIIVISHRLASLVWVDRLLMLDGGMLVAEGAHTDMYQRSKLYRDLFNDYLSCGSFA